MNYFEFYNPVKILSGIGALENIPYELNIRGATHPIIITSNTPVKVNLVAILIKALDNWGMISDRVFSDVEKESSFKTVERASKIFRDGGCDSIIALGGGSVLDTAKGVKILVSHEADSLDAFMGNETIAKGISLPLFMIPTTAGTGSECSKVAVISRGDIKHEFISSEIIPDIAVIDPRTTITLPPRITAASGMDAIVHAIEAYTCLQKNPISDSFAMGALELIGKNLINVVDYGNNIEYRIGMANAALMSGIAFSNSMVGLCHAVAHACGGVTKVAHGEAVGILMPAVMRYNMDSSVNGVSLSDLYGKVLLGLSGEEVYAETQSRKRADKAIERIEEIMGYLHQKSGISVSLEGAGVERKYFQEIAEKAMDDGAILLNSKRAGKKEIIEILEAAR